MSIFVRRIQIQKHNAESLIDQKLVTDGSMDENLTNPKEGGPPPVLAGAGAADAEAEEVLTPPREEERPEQDVDQEAETPSDEEDDAKGADSGGLPTLAAVTQTNGETPVGGLCAVLAAMNAEPAVQPIITGGM